jgi:hypothetical protein
MYSLYVICRMQKDSEFVDQLPSRIFRNDPVAARLLGKLYGFSHYEKSIPLEKKTSKVHQPLIQPRWNNVRNKDMHLSSSHKASVRTVIVPWFGTRKSKNDILPIHTIPRRRSIDACKETIDISNEINRKYRPPMGQSYRGKTYEDEKKRLNEIFSYKGGNALPITYSISCKRFDDNTDHVDIIKKRQDSRLARITLTTTKQITHCEKQDDSVRNQILLEIDERKEFRTALESEKSRSCDELRRKIDQEISLRMNELRRIDPNYDKVEC